MGILTSHYKDPYQPTSIMESNKVFFFVAHWYNISYDGFKLVVYFFLHSPPGLVLGDVWYIYRQGVSPNEFVLRCFTCTHCLKSTFCEVWVSGTIEPFPRHPGKYVLTRWTRGCLVYDPYAQIPHQGMLGGSFLDDSEDWKFTWPRRTPDPKMAAKRWLDVGLFLAENTDL